MRLTAICLSAVFFLSNLASADETLTAESLNKLKAATVFIKVEAGKERASGSGFVIRTEGRTAYVVTNHHVIDMTPEGESRPGALNTVISLVFNSGESNEQSVRGEVVATDPLTDLAVIKAANLTKMPPSIELAESVKLMETMPVFILGFPLGELLATNKGNPAITVGKGTIASLRKDQAGELTTVQVDGDMTPGNSGGPVVDSQGRLIGVTAATIRSRRIGFAIPTAKLNRLLKGRLLEPKFISRPVASGLEVRLELGLFDPFNQLKDASFYYHPGVKRAEKNLAGLSGVQQVKLERKTLQMEGIFTLDLTVPGDPTITYQATYTDGDKQNFVTIAQEKMLPRKGGTVPPPKTVVAAASKDPMGKEIPKPPPPSDTRGKTTVDLMPLIDTTKDVVLGKWDLKENTLFCTDTKDNQRVEIPFRPPVEYDLIVVFSQPKMRNGIAMIMPNPKGGSFWWTIAGFNGKSYHLGVKNAGVTFVRPKFLEPDTAYTTTVQVRRDSVRCLLDGKELKKHMTDYSDMSGADSYELRDATLPGVCCADPTVFHYIRLVEVTGKGSKLP